jgi:hypothetical protein
MSREESIRKEILFQLYAVRPLALSPERIALDARKNDYDYTAKEVRREAEFLGDEGLIFKIEEPGTSVVMYRIHANGVKQYERKYRQ